MAFLIDIDKITTNSNNPRIIKDSKFKDLVNSIREFPEMLEKRPIIVDENMIVLGWNMRLKACQEAGLKEIHIDIAKWWTQKQKDAFIIKDNISYWEWDLNILANEWQVEDLEEWWVDIDFNLEEINFDNIESNTDREPTPKEKEIICPSCKHNFII